MPKYFERLLGSSLLLALPVGVPMYYVLQYFFSLAWGWDLFIAEQTVTSLALVYAEVRWRREEQLKDVDGVISRWVIYKGDREDGGCATASFFIAPTAYAAWGIKLLLCYVANTVFYSAVDTVIIGDLKPIAQKVVNTVYNKKALKPTLERTVTPSLGPSGRGSEITIIPH